MRQALHSLATEWERPLLWCALTVALCSSLLWLRPNTADGDLTDSRPPKARTSILGPHAYAFLDSNAQDLTKPDESLFQFSFQVPLVEEARQPASVDAGTPKDSLPPTQKVLAADEPDQNPAVGCAAAREPRTLRYLGVYVSTTGQRLAAVQVAEPYNGPIHRGFWQAGESCGDVRLESFDSARLRFLVPTGEHGTVERGANVPLPLQ
jgi:hypothetical protein